MCDDYYPVLVVHHILNLFIKLQQHHTKFPIDNTQLSA